MMRRSGLLLMAGFLALAGTGCSRSPRVSFYTLEPVPLAQPATAGAAAAAPAGAGPAAAPGTAAAPAAGLSVSVGPVTLPESVDRPQLVVRVAPNRVEVLEEQRWAEPLKSAIPRVVARDLEGLLASSRVFSYLESAATHPDCRVLLDIVRFEAAPGEYVGVEATWTVRRHGGEGRRTGRTQLREPVRGVGYDAVAEAYGRALYALSADLAAAVRAEFAAPR